MTFATNMQAVANRLLTKFGESVTFTRQTEGTYSTSTLSTGSDASSTTYTGYGFIYPYSKGEIDGTEVLRTDSRFLVEKMTSVPLVGDTVSVDSITYRVMNVETIRAQGLDVVYDLQLRV